MTSRTNENMVIDARQLCLTFDANDGPVHALKDVDLSIEKGISYLSSGLRDAARPRCCG